MAYRHVRKSPAETEATQTPTCEETVVTRKMVDTLLRIIRETEGEPEERERRLTQFVESNQQQ